MADPIRAHQDDPRVTPARSDIAAKHLEGRAQARRHVEGTPRQVVVPSAPVRHEPRPDALLDTEALRGEIVTVYETTEEGWSWGQLKSDSYVGWLPTDALGPVGAPATHRVAAPRTLMFPAPSLKTTPLEGLSFGCRLAIARIDSQFAVTAASEFVPLRHLVDVNAQERDFVSVAERFLGVPYLWGGKTSAGLDCSALVQLSLNACGVPCWRDSDMQEASFLPRIEPADDLSNLQRGDLIFWEGHVAIVRDRSTLIHANGHHMAVAIEPIADAVARNRADRIALSSVRRLQGVPRGDQ
ncbi:MAG: C40 family peptidase [Xanthobacteraceae bacterium]|nr:C40 family peptidase [Xanthobacteraceae bacterium]